jgi:hypothetical protein
VLALAGLVRANPVTFEFAGTVTEVFDGLGTLEDRVDEGAPFSGAYTFESNTPNTAEPVSEGEAGLYEHDLSPAGVEVRVGGFVFQNRSDGLDFDVIVNDNFCFTRADEYGFVSQANEIVGVPFDPPFYALSIRWLASTIAFEPFSNVDLPTTPPSLELLGGGLFEIHGDCVVCAGPAAFFRVEGTLTSLTVPEPSSGVLGTTALALMGLLVGITQRGSCKSRKTPQPTGPLRSRRM